VASLAAQAVMLVGIPPAVGVTTKPVFSPPKLRYFWPAPSITAEGGSPPGQLFWPPAKPSFPTFIVAACATETKAIVVTRIDLIEAFYSKIRFRQEIKLKIIINIIHGCLPALIFPDFEIILAAARENGPRDWIPPRLHSLQMLS
jgi:hypothetical protein